jgi:RNA polymerase sigma-70 factor (ECF subfamily)
MERPGESGPEGATNRVSAEHDDRLMTAVRAGDVSQLGVLFERHHRALFNFFLRLTGDRQASEDLVQDVFVRILKSRATYQPGTQFRTWMYQVARSAHIDRFRSRPREQPADPEALRAVSPAAAPGSGLEQAQEAQLLRKALAALPEDKREVLVLSRFQGLKYQEIGALLGCEEGAVKVRVFRAIRALRDIYLGLVEGGAPGNTQTAEWMRRNA